MLTIPSTLGKFGGLILLELRIGGVRGCETLGAAEPQVQIGSSPTVLK